MEMLIKSLTLLSRKLLKKIALIAVIMNMFGPSSSSINAATIEENILKSYEQYENTMQSLSSYFKEKRERKAPKIEKADYIQSEPDQYQVNGDAYAYFWLNPIRVRLFCNSPLFDDLDKKKHDPFLLPKLTITQALEKGKGYLKAFDIVPGSGFELKKISFNENWQECWGITWGRIADNRYSWDDFDKTITEKIYVSFHETYGLVRVDNIVYTPEPKNLLVKIQREQAILKAAQCAPLVFKTPFYCNARAGGFVIKGLKSCELRVAIPNWLLDPQRAWWPREHPPTETRLCWVVRFTTVDSKAAERKTKDGTLLRLIPPDIVIYLDAETGECVGASCT